MDKDVQAELREFVTDNIPGEAQWEALSPVARRTLEEFLGIQPSK